MPDDRGEARRRRNATVQRMRTPIWSPPDPMYTEFEVHRSMISDRVRTEAFQRAIDSVVRPGDIVLDVGAGSGILSMFAARAGAARVYAVEQTSIAVLAQELAVANGVLEIVQVLHGDIVDIELPERVDVIVSEWLGGFGIDEGMLVPVIAARDRWLKPGGVMIPSSVTAWTALVHDRYLGEMVEFLRAGPYGLDLEPSSTRPSTRSPTPAASVTLRRVTALRAESLVDDEHRADPARAGAGTSRSRDAAPPSTTHGTANALALWFSAELAPDISFSVGPGDPPTHWGMTTAPLRSPVELTPGMVVRARVRTALARPSRDVDALGHRDAGRRLGRARRAGDLGGDRRLSSPMSTPGHAAWARSTRWRARWSGRVVGRAVLPAAPDDVDPGAGEDARRHGDGSCRGLARSGIEVGRPGVGAAAVLRRSR